MIPRGGHCKSCKQYTLWGDVIRGCYRRMPPSEAANPLLDIDTDDMFISDDLEGNSKSPIRRKRNATSTKRRRSLKETRQQRLRSGPTSTSHENGIFDLRDPLASLDSENVPGPVKKKPGRPRKIPTMLSPLTSPKGSGKQRLRSSSTSPSYEIFDSSTILTSSDNEDILVKKKPGRSHKIPTMLPPLTSSKGSGKQRLRSRSTSPSHKIFDSSNILTSSDNEDILAKKKPGRPRKIPTMLPPLTSSKDSGKQRLPSSSTSPSHEIFDLSNILTSSDNEDILAKKQPGRPRKIPTTLSSSKGSGKQRLRSSSTSPSHEIFDLSNILTSSDNEDILAKKKPGRPRKIPTMLSPPTSSKFGGKQKSRSSSASPSHENGTFDSSNQSSDNDNNPGPVKKKPGRPRKIPVILSPVSSKGSGKQWLRSK